MNASKYITNVLWQKKFCDHILREPQAPPRASLDISG